MKHNFSIQDGNLLLRPLQGNDIENLRNWRNDPVTTRYLRPIGYITEDMQKKWYDTYLNNPTEAAFAIVETSKFNRMIGSIAIYDVKNGTAEIGKFLIGDSEARGSGYGSRSIAMAAQIAFACMGLKRVISSVHQDNIPSYKSFTKNGFRKFGCHPCVVGGIEDELELLQSDFDKMMD